MKKNVTALLSGILMSLLATANDSLLQEATAKKHINFFIISKPKKGKLDPASRFNIIRTKVKSFFQKDKFVSIVAGSADYMSRKVQSKLKKHNASIGTLWFDSHGLYKRGHSVFFIGKHEYDFRNIRDSDFARPLLNLKPYSSYKTNVVIGSCYGGATFTRISLHSSDSTRMNGDSLMIGLASIFQGASIYGSESWVMTKPGLFRGGEALAGYPLRKIFRDIVYQPAWEHVGVWNRYSQIEKTVQRIPPVALDRFGNLCVRPNPYLDRKKEIKKVVKKIQKLKPDLLKV